MLQETAHEWAVHNFESGCEVADMLVQRLDIGPDVREALGFTFERWNGNSFPTHARGEAIPLPMRVVHLSHDMEAIARIFSADHAVDAARDRRDLTYDPELADLFVAHGRDWLDRLATTEPWDAVLALEPEPRRVLDGEDLDNALEVAADFIDLKSPYMVGHSRRCAELATDAAGVLGLSEPAITTLRRAALVHDFGTTAVSNSIWDKPGPLTRTEFDRVELHPMLTEQMLRRSPPLADLNPVACAHHEKCDGSGYHKRVRADDDPGACVLAATEIYVGLTRERADRPALSGEDAAAELGRLDEHGVIEPRACRARGRRARRAAPIQTKAPAESGRAHRARSRSASPRGTGTHHARGRRAALHLPQDRRPPHPAHLRQDRRIDPSRRRTVGLSTRRRRLSDRSRREPPAVSPASRTDNPTTTLSAPGTR